MQTILPRIIPAQKTDLSDILTLFENVKKALNEKGMYQWPDHYPSIDQFKSAIEEKEVWIVKIDGQIAGTYTLNAQQDASYAQIKWKYQQGESLVLHRLAIDPEFQGQGLGRSLVEHALQTAVDKNADHMRLDTWSRNPASVKLYSTMGFERAKGFCYFHGHTEPFYCFEKKLRPS